jgi:hypothetical protein
VSGYFVGVPGHLWFLSRVLNTKWPISEATPERLAEWREVSRIIAERNAFFRTKKRADFLPLEQSFCPECGKGFVPVKAGMIYDSEECANRFRQRRFKNARKLQGDKEKELIAIK